MKTLTTFFLCVLAIAGPAQTSVKTFTSPDGVFRFRYSDMHVNCTQSPASGSCMSQA
jgi:hypothetical protein